MFQKCFCKTNFVIFVYIYACIHAQNHTLITCVCVIELLILKIKRNEPLQVGKSLESSTQYRDRNTSASCLCVSSMLVTSLRDGLDSIYILHFQK